MFEDLIKEDKKLSEMACKNCKYGSLILSRRYKKVMCQLYKRHKPYESVCSEWEKKLKVNWRRPKFKDGKLIRSI